MTLYDKEVQAIKTLLETSPPDCWGQMTRGDLEYYFQADAGMDIGEASQLSLKCLLLGIGDDGSY